MKKIIILSCVMLLLCSGCALFQKYTSGQSGPAKTGRSKSGILRLS